VLLSAPAPAIVGQAEQPGPLFLHRTLKVILPKGMCSAVVIGPQLVMTAAHCVTGVSSAKMAGATTGLIETTKIAPHPRFAGSAAPDADIALLKPAKALPEMMSPATLVARPVRKGESLTVVGYGLHDRGKPDGAARMAALLVTEVFDNAFTLGDPVSMGELSKRGACNGDSGAPAFSLQGGGLFLVGIVRGSDYCGGTTLVTSLVLYRAWIEETARQLGAQLGP
jgi:secreted trypsin-like serine protease